MNIILSGIGGHMGHEVLKLAQSGCRQMQVIAGVDPVADASDFPIPVAKCFEELEDSFRANVEETTDAVVDFSNHVSTRGLTAFAQKHGLPLVIATTGQTEEELEMIKAASQNIPVFFAANYSMGIALLAELAKKTAAAMPDAEIEIIETHHDRKLDAPSGTALTLAHAIKEVRPGAEIVCGRSGIGKREPGDIGISSVRIGNVVGIHEILIGTQNQTITLKHEAHSRALFAEGALAAAEFIAGKPAGLYDMKSIVE